MLPINAPTAAERLAAIRGGSVAPTPDKAAIERRQAVRSTIAELNAADMETIRNRIAATSIDERTPVERALDVLDLPGNLIRNAVAQVVAPSAVAESRETDTFGIPKVYTSDVLRQLGVENRVVRGIVGFVGDVALDPLTYIGPGAFKSAGSALVRREGNAVLKASLREAAEGGLGAVRNPLARDLIESSVGSAERLERLRNAAASAEKVAKVGAPGSAERVKYVRGLLNERVRMKDIAGTPGGMLGQALRAPLAGEAAESVARTNAARSFLRKYGRGTGRGIKIGEGGSEIAHVPFTDITVQVPAFTKVGRQTLAQHQLVRDNLTGAVTAAAKLGPAADVMRAGLATQRELLDRLNEARSLRDAGFPEWQQLYETTRDLKDQTAHMDEAIRSALLTAANDAPLTASDAMAYGELRRESRAIAEYHAARIREIELGRTLTAPDAIAKREALAGERLFEDTVIPTARAQAANLSDAEKEAIAAYKAVEPKYQLALEGHTSAIEAANRLANLYEAPIATLLSSDERGMVEVAKMALGVGDSQIGVSALSSMRAAIEAAGERTGPRAIAAEALDAIEASINKIHQSPVSGDVGAKIRALRAAQGGPSLEVQMRMADIGKRLEQSFPGRRDEALTALLLKVTERAGDTSNYAMTYRKIGDEYGKVVESALSEGVKNARKSGILADPGAEAILDELADSALAGLRKAKDAELRTGILGDTLESYVPNVASDAFRDAIAAQRKRIGGQMAGGKGLSDEFTIDRTTKLYEWTDGNGVDHWFYDFQRALTAATPLEIEARFGSNADKVMKLVEDIHAYDEALKQGVTLAKPKLLDPMTINKIEQDGGLAFLTGGPIRSEAFDTNPIRLIERRLHASEIARAKSDLARSIGAVSLNPGPDTVSRLTRAAREGGRVITANGVDFHILPSSEGVRVAVGSRTGPVFRTLSDSARASVEHPMMKLLGASADGMLVPEIVARKVDDILGVPVERILQSVTQISNAWRAITLLHPSWIINNVYGNVTNWLATGLPAPDMATGARLMRVMRHASNPEALAKIKPFEFAGKVRSPQEIVSLLNDRGMWGTTLGEYERGNLVARGLMPLPSHKAMIPIEGVQAAARSKAAWKAVRTMPEDYRAAYAAYRDAGRTVVGSTAKAASTVATDRFMRAVAGPWFKSNQRIEEWFRAMAFDANVRAGADEAASAQKVVETFFDYGDLSRIEKAKIKPLVPFYAWLKNNSLLQMRLLFERPEIAASFPKIQNFVEEALNGEQRLPAHMRPRWMRQELAIQIGSNPETRQAVLAGSSLPLSDIYRYVGAATGPEGVQEMLHWFGSNLSPVYTSALQLGVGREFFSDRSIGDPDVADIGRGEFVLKQIRPLSELGIGSLSGGPLGRAAEQGVGPLAARVLLGGKIQDFSQERIDRQNLRDLKERETGLRRNIARAEKVGSKSESLRLRIELMRVYKMMQRAGLEVEVPRWAREQLASV